MPRACLRLCVALALASARTDLAAVAAAAEAPPSVLPGAAALPRLSEGAVFLEPSDPLDPLHSGEEEHKKEEHKDERTRQPTTTVAAEAPTAAPSTPPEEEETTTQPQETTTPPPPKTPPAIFKSIADAIFYELYQSPNQWVNAVLALAFGIALVADGVFVFKWVLISTISLVAMIMAMNVLTTAWDLSFQSYLRHIVGFEAFFVCGFAALKGFEGLQVATGAALGALTGERLLTLLASWGLVARHWFMVTIYSVFSLSFLAMFNNKGHHPILAFLAPAVGGAFATSAVAFAVTEMAANGQLNWLPLHGLQPVTGKWVEFLCLIWQPHSRDVGLFAGSPYTTEALGLHSNLDRLLGRLFWALLFAGGFLKQCLKRRRRPQIASGLGGSSSEPLLAADAR